DGEVYYVRLIKSGKSLGLDEIRKINWEYLGVFRDGEGLKKALEIYEAIDNSSITQEANASLVSLLSVKAALLREESRGSHYRTDFPKRRDIWRRRIYFKVKDND
ncbi:L-aspartate oxidase, partial [Sulfolobus sp. A20-N-F6]